MKNPMTHALAIAAAMTLLSGCGGTEVTNTAAESSQPTAATASDTTSPVATQGTDEGDRDSAENLTKSFGSTFTWDDGIAITVTAPQPFKPSSYVTDFQQNKKLTEYVIMDVTLKNGSKEALSPIMVNIQATTGESDAEAIFDSEKGVDLPTADILPGKTKKWKAAFARAEGEPFVVQVDNNTTLAATGYYK